jgi:hypothetical protein
MKKILFVASEPELLHSTGCSRDLNAIQNAQLGSNYEDLYKIIYCIDATIDNVIDFVERSSPELFHYCGHGNIDGEPILRNHDGHIIPFRSNILADILQRTSDFECMVFCSCNSAELINGLKRFSENTIGFTGEVVNSDMHRFASVFYGELFKIGSPFHAYLNTVDRIRANIQQGNQLIFTTKLNDFMEQSLNKRLTVAQAEQLAVEQNVILTDNLLQVIGDNIATAEKSYNSDFINVVKTHPAPDEMIWFAKTKDYYASEIAQLVFRKKTKDEIEELAQELEILFLALETSLLYYQDHNRIKTNILQSISGSECPDTLYIEALEELKIYKFGRKFTDNFDKLFTRTIDLCIAIIGSRTSSL